MSILREDQLKRLAELLENKSYDGTDKIYRENTTAVYSDIPVLEYGDFGGNCRQLGVYGYRGFDVVITDENGGEPRYGYEFTLGIYHKGECETPYLFNLDFFNFTRAVKQVNLHIDWVEEQELKLSSKMGEIEANDFMGFISEGQEAFIAGKKECTCGAKHTSNPGFHTDWCDIK